MIMKLLIILSFLIIQGCVTSEKSAFKTIGAIERLDPELDNLVDADAGIELLAEGFEWSEGPVWIKNGQYLLFNDIPTNTLYKWSDEEGLSVFLRPAGLSMDRDDRLIQFGCNGLYVNPLDDQLIICEHGNRCLSQLDQKNWIKRTIVNTYEGKKFNSPNDVVVSSKGQMYFTDPPYGLVSVDGSPENNPLKELDFSGVYHFIPGGGLTLVTKRLDRPNGIILSPDEKTLYVANSGENAVWLAFDVADDGAVSNERLFFDARPRRKSGKKGACDGMTVDERGNLWATGPGGVMVITPQGKHLGTIGTGVSIANCCFGGKTGDYLYMTSDMYLCRIKVKVKGSGF